MGNKMSHEELRECRAIESLNTKETLRAMSESQEKAAILSVVYRDVDCNSSAPLDNGRKNFCTIGSRWPPRYHHKLLLRLVRHGVASANVWLEFGRTGITLTMATPESMPPSVGGLIPDSWIAEGVPHGLVNAAHCRHVAQEYKSTITRCIRGNATMQVRELAEVCEAFPCYNVHIANCQHFIAHVVYAFAAAAGAPVVPAQRCCVSCGLECYSRLPPRVQAFNGVTDLCANVRNELLCCACLVKVAEDGVHHGLFACINCDERVREYRPDGNAKWIKDVDYYHGSSSSSCSGKCASEVVRIVVPAGLT